MLGMLTVINDYIGYRKVNRFIWFRFKRELFIIIKINGISFIQIANIVLFLFKFKITSIFRLGLINRLDRLTVGLIFIVINGDRCLTIKSVNNNYGIGNKVYLAKVDIVRREEVIINYINKYRGIKWFNYYKDKYRSAKLILNRLLIVEYGDRLINLVRCNTIEGRSHQVRIQCYSINRKIIGDNVYGSYMEEDRDGYLLNYISINSVCINYYWYYNDYVIKLLYDIKIGL